MDEKLAHEIAWALEVNGPVYQPDRISCGQWMTKNSVHWISRSRFKTGLGGTMRNRAILNNGNKTRKGGCFMLYKELIELFDILDSASASGSEVVEYLKAINPMCQAETYPLAGPNGHTDMVRILIPGRTEVERRKCGNDRDPRTPRRTWRET